jgi:hypothetical protein
MALALPAPHPDFGLWALGFGLSSRHSHARPPKPTAEANGCNLRHLTPKTLQKALYVGHSESVRPLQVV